MNLKDIPPTVLVRNALEAFTKAEIKATVIYSVDKNGRQITRADTNVGPQGMARHLAAVRVQDGAIERAAIALHEFRLELPPELDTTEERAAMDKCPLCGMSENWSVLGEPDRDGHRQIVKFVVGHALAAPPSSNLVSV